MEEHQLNVEPIRGMARWTEHVEAYAERLEILAGQMAEALASNKAATEAGDVDALRGVCARIEPLLKRLEEGCKRRESLLTQYAQLAAPVPDLRTALRSVGGQTDPLALRLDRIGAALAEAQRQAVALFIANHHLLETQTQLLRLISTGSASSATYDRAGNETAGLFDRAA